MNDPKAAIYSATKIPSLDIPTIARVGECCLLIEFAQNITPTLPAVINSAVQRINQTLVPAPINCIPSYTTLLLEFSPLSFNWAHITTQLTSLLAEQTATDKCTAHPIIEVPVYYGKSVALDAERYQRLTELSLSEIQTLHSSVIYQVYALGFSPGFAFMADVPKALQLPRLNSPRAVVPQGSVAIAGPQTAVYPQASPGGWNVIGRTPIELYTPNKPSMTLLSAGDQVRFVPITKAEFKLLGGAL
ncbi:putative regulatory protein [Vibrio halioticoli NBRC 102217]|uniref:Putative regulatory protein n=1 Tax=Vibrio halioticoli NBRC 102217 TaxID=1219072 RepID=V5HP61_9VIBR|nr:5-oxoprolinase subunit PxpB [Vibrio halioticoli]GAD91030.1 putative regulatory protein [Vibrio halioticoli NBRC 102217]